MTAARAGKLLFVALLLFLFVGFVCYPVGVLVVESFRGADGFSLATYRAVLDVNNRANLEAVGNSIGVSILSTLFSALVGLLFAFVFTQFDVPFRSTLARIAVMPIALPPLVGVVAFLFVFGESGVLPRSLQHVFGMQGVPFALDGISAIVAVHVYSFYVYSYMFCATALRGIDASLLEAAATLGASSWRTFRKVVLPELKPALLGSSLLTFMASMASFSAPLIFAGGRRFIALQIYTTKLNGDLNLAAAQSILLVVVSVGFFLGANLIVDPRSLWKAGKGTSRPGRLRTGRVSRAVLLTLAFALLFLEALPIAMIVLVSFSVEGSWTSQILPTAYTLRNYASLITQPEIVEPIRNSLVMAAGALVLALVAGVGGAYMLTDVRPGRARMLVDLAMTVPYAIPGTVLAIALILAFSTPTVFSGFSVLVGTVWLLPVAYAIRTYPLLARATSSSLAGVDTALTEAAEVFGAGQWMKFRRVVLPLILPGIVSGALLAAIASVGEFVSSILLYTYSNRPIAVEILAQLRSFSFGTAAAYCVILLLIILLLVGLSSLVTRRAEYLRQE
jgi:iron(III) transport system permease protein